jgi:hypothetical protein
MTAARVTEMHSSNVSTGETGANHNTARPGTVVAGAYGAGVSYLISIFDCENIKDLSLFKI